MTNFINKIFTTLCSLLVIINTNHQLCFGCDYLACSPTVQNPDNEYIYRVKFGTIDKTSGTQSNVANYTALSTEINIGENYSIIVFNGDAAPEDQVRVFIDWNQDCDFNDTGETYVLSTSDNGWTFTGFISVPINAKSGTTRMRVRMTFNSTPSPCDFSLYGEVEDYSVNVITTPLINIQSLVDTIFCIGESFQISYQAQGLFNEGNNFSVQLSEKNGNFDNPLSIGTLISTSSGNINCTTPDIILDGNNYFLRVISSNPQVISSPKGPLTINTLPTIFNLIGDGFYCSNDKNGTVIELDSSQDSVSYQLKKDGTDFGNPILGMGDTIKFVSIKDEGSYTIEATSIAGCINMMNGTVIVKAIQRPAQFKIKSGNIVYDTSIDTSFCADDNGIEIGLDGSELNTKYILKLNGNEEISVMNGTGFDLNFGYFEREGKYTIEAITYDGSCINTMLGSIKIKRIELPTKYNIKGSDYFCLGSEGAEIKLSDSKMGILYQLLRDGDAIGAPIAGTGNSISFGKQNIVGLYTVEAKTIDGNCTNAMNGSINLREIQIPEIKINGNKTPNYGDIESYTDSKDSEGDNYNWSVIGGTILGSNSNDTINVRWSNNKIGKVQLTKNNDYGCENSSAIEINLVNNIIAGFVADTTIGAAPFEVKFIDKSTGYINTWNWEFGDGESSIIQHPTHIYKIPGIYNVQLTASYEDQISSKTIKNMITVEKGVGINEDNPTNYTCIYLSAIEPNPSSEVIRFYYSTSSSQDITIAIYNMLGERVATISEGYKAEGTYNKEITVSQLPSGAYYLQILGKVGQINQMINIMR